MNRQGPNGIGYCTHTWNPITGCKKGCDYCFAREIIEERLCKNPKLSHNYPNGFAPTFHPTRLDQPFKTKKPAKIFVCDMADMFGDWVSSEWLEAITVAIGKADWHTYLFLTKNPERYAEFVFAKNHWVGTTIEHEKHYLERSKPFWDNHLEENIKFVSMEPLLSSMPVDSAFDWIIIGEQSGKKHSEEEWKDIVNWTTDIISQAKKLDTPVFVKNKLGDIFHFRELPRGVT